MRPLVSFFTVAMAATHGVYRSVNTRNVNAVAGVNTSWSAATLPPTSTVSVETTLSLAMNPVMSAVEARQSPKPSGANTGAIAPPMRASRLSSGLSASVSPALKVWRNHTISVARNTTVNAFWMKPFAFSQTRRATLFALGRR